ncbi:hypothetical protein B0H14DRAFT_2611222 [Mycena olivaceomarginata]|nr:hypothetical protein B0H14DRAFT_2611222 [Mycena olivaceomarginata]
MHPVHLRPAPARNRPVIKVEYHSPSATRDTELRSAVVHEIRCREGVRPAQSHRPLLHHDTALVHARRDGDGGKRECARTTHAFGSRLREDGAAMGGFSSLAAPGLGLGGRAVRSIVRVVDLPLVFGSRSAACLKEQVLKVLHSLQKERTIRLERGRDSGLAGGIRLVIGVVDLAFSARVGSSLMIRGMRLASDKGERFWILGRDWIGVGGGSGENEKGELTGVCLAAAIKFPILG